MLFPRHYPYTFMTIHFLTRTCGSTERIYMSVCVVVALKEGRWWIWVSTFLRPLFVLAGPSSVSFNSIHLGIRKNINYFAQKHFTNHINFYFDLCELVNS